LILYQSCLGINRLCTGPAMYVYSGGLMPIAVHPRIIYPSTKSIYQPAAYSGINIMLLDYYRKQFMREANSSFLR
jgi:hypothetical protein